MGSESQDNLITYLPRVLIISFVALVVVFIVIASTSLIIDVRQTELSKISSNVFLCLQENKQEIGQTNKITQNLLDKCVPQTDYFVVYAEYNNETIISPPTQRILKVSCDNSKANAAKCITTIYYLNINNKIQEIKLNIYIGKTNENVYQR